MKVIGTLLVCLVLYFQNQACAWRLLEIGPHFQLIGEEGDVVRLAGIEIVRADDARRLIESMSNQFWRVRANDRGHDRWGARLVDLLDDRERSLQAVLLGRGLALCRPDLADGCDPGWLAAEREARFARLGIWAGALPLAARQAAGATGEYALIQGRILHSEETRRYTYWNFGETWKTDFTVRVPNKAAKKWAKTGFDLLALEGAMVQVRGFVFEENGPMIELSDVRQVEIVP